MYLRRALEPRVALCSQHFKIIAVMGPRQVGKTTMLRHMAREEQEATGIERTYVSLDIHENRELAQRDPALFMQVYRPPVLIDEVQKAPELFPYLKIHADETDTCGTVWLTGSQPLHLKKAFSESLAGRIALLELYGFSQSELTGRTTEPFRCDPRYFLERTGSCAPVTAPELYHTLWKGSLPAIALGPDELWRDAYSSYVETYLLRDIRDATAVKDEDRFRRFMGACAALTGQPANYATLAQAADISETTARDWLSLLMSSYIVRMLRPYTNNLLKRLQKQPVLHFTDTGLAAYLAGWTESEALFNGALGGHILETFSWNELEKSWAPTNAAPQTSFLRTDRKKEIDLVLTANGMTHPLEVKRTASPHPDDLKNFSVLDPLGDARGLGAVLCLTTTAFPIVRDAWAFPVWAI